VRWGKSDQTSENVISGTAHGPVVQAGSVGQVHFHSAARPAPVIPFQLPPAPRLFASRQEELTELDGWRDADDDHPLVAVISGPGGVGKTSLALRWLHDAREHYPDGQLFLDLAAFSPAGPTRSEEALECFLLALGVPPEQVPAELPQRTAMFRSVTAGLAVVLLLDNAYSAAQIRPLLPASASCAVVVTSRWRLAGLGMDGARFVELEPMETGASVELLANAVGERRLTAESSAARELADLCGGVPLALSVVAARLSAHPRRSLSREVDDLRAERGRFSGLTLGQDVSVEAVFDLSYEKLTAGQARAYRACSVHPGAEFAADVVADALEKPVEDIRTTLHSLTEANLLFELEDHRFRYHDLLRLHARRKAESEGLNLSRRMIEWYLDTLVAADLVIRPTRRRVAPRFRTPQDRGDLFRTHTEAVEWLSRERANLREACRRSAELGLDELVWQFCEAMWGFFLHTRHYGDWLALHALGIPAARRCGNRAAEGKLRAQLTYTFAALHRYDEALREGAIALRLAEEDQDAQALAVALTELSGAAQGSGDLTAALEYLVRTREIRREIGTPRALALCERRIGEVLADLERYPEAVSRLRVAAEAMARLGDVPQQAGSLMSLGRTNLRRGQPAQADADLREAVALVRAAGMPYYEAEALTLLGEVAETIGDLPSARTHYSAAFDLYTEVEEPKAAVVRAKLVELDSRT
jgi:tetratricopeptide (TPR) repeat protein